ncbi:MAG TPA: hypothetical protein VIK27_02960 [Candidatus Aquilonibacter sp.]
MKPSSPSDLSWPQLLAALRGGAGETVLIRDGKRVEAAQAVRSRPAATGTEFSLFSGDGGAMTRLALIAHLETLAKGHGRRFTKPARAQIDGSSLLVVSVSDEEVEGTLHSVIATRRSSLGFNPSQQTGDRTTLRSKRIKTI